MFPSYRLRHQSKNKLATSRPSILIVTPITVHLYCVAIVPQSCELPSPRVSHKGIHPCMLLSISSLASPGLLRRILEIETSALWVWICCAPSPNHVSQLLLHPQVFRHGSPSTGTRSSLFYFFHILRFSLSYKINTVRKTAVSRKIHFVLATPENSSLYNSVSRRFVPRIFFHQLSCHPYFISLFSHVALLTSIFFEQISSECREI